MQQKWPAFNLLYWNENAEKKVHLQVYCLDHMYIVTKFYHYNKQRAQEPVRVLLNIRTEVIQLSMYFEKALAITLASSISPQSKLKNVTWLSKFCLKHMVDIQIFDFNCFGHYSSFVNISHIRSILYDFHYKH